MNNEETPSDKHGDHERDYQARLRAAFEAHEHHWRMALDENQHERPRPPRLRQRLRGPLLACAILATVSALVIGPNTPLGQRVNHEISNTIAQFTAPHQSLPQTAASPSGSPQTLS